MEKNKRLKLTMAFPIRKRKGVFQGRKLNFKKRRMTAPAKRARGQISRARALAVANTSTAGFLGLEKKFIDTYIASTGISIVESAAEMDPTGSCLNGIAVGDGESNRDGNRYVIKKVQIRGEVYCSTQTLQIVTHLSPTVRVYLVLDTQTNGAQLNSEDVFTSAGGSGSAVDAFRNLKYSSRFRILAARTLNPTYRIATNNAAATTITMSSDIVPFEMNVPLDLPVQCTGTGGTIASIADNSLHVIAFSDAAYANLRYTARVRYMG